MPPLGPDNSDRRYWRSLDDLAQTPEFRALAEQEFPGGAWDRLDEPSRRQFLKMMAASLALAGMVGCRWPKEEILPYAYRPARRTPGVPEHYATAMELGGVATGLLVTSYDGRPIKIEGNPSHPYSLGGTSAIHQASILDLYDPDRSRTVVRREGGQTIKHGWSEFEAFAKPHLAELRKRKGKGLAILSEATSSPSVADQRRRLAKTMPQARWFEYEPVSWDNEREAFKTAFGKPCRVEAHLDQADVIVCFGADPLMNHPASLRHARDFAKGRRGTNFKMNRLYVVESGQSVTGSMADHRLAVPPSRTRAVAYGLLEEVARLDPEWQTLEKEMHQAFANAGKTLLRTLGVRVPKGTKPGRSEKPEAKQSKPFALLPEEASFVTALAKDMIRHRDRCLVLAGPQQPPDIHVVSCLLLQIPLSKGKSRLESLVTLRETPDTDRPTHVQAIKDLTAAMAKSEVDTLLILGGNPVYDAPADVDFAGALTKVKTSIHLSLYDDETSAACTWHVPRAHYLESWADARAWDGTVSIVQPLIAPLYDGKTPAELLALTTGDKLTDAYAITRRTFQQLTKPKDLEQAWRTALHEGVVANTAWPVLDPDAKREPAEPSELESISVKPEEPAADDIQVTFNADHSVYDGRFAGNGWLQEWPDPLTKLTWDNAAVMSPKMAHDLGVHDGDWVEVTVGERSVKLPAFILPGQADKTIALALGYGRRRAGTIGTGAGVDVYPLRTSTTMHLATGAKVARTTGPDGARSMKLATTQNQHPVTEVTSNEKRRRIRKLIREADLSYYKAHPEFAEHLEHHPPLKSLWPEHEYRGHRWAMAIDLSACIGCGACVVACQAENNVPVVGKTEVLRGRVMHWIRLDRYFAGDPDRAQAVHMPMTCLQCENAPCEQVCPVAATVHDQEGLNVMVYNRCVGTRYCSNNCPVKVRRFNFFSYQRDLSDTQKMLMNPEVTVRSRGVMEKCSYCVQRINAAKIVAKNERRPVRDGEITTACAQACPTGAILFGDLNDPDSRIAKLLDPESGDKRAYDLLAGLNIKPRTTYLARLRNRNADLGGGKKHEEHHG